MNKNDSIFSFTEKELSHFTSTQKVKLLQLIQQPFLDSLVTPMLVPTIPITPAQENQFLALMQTFQITVNAYLINPNVANNTALRNSMTNLYNFLLNEFPTQQERDATRYSLFLLLTISNRLAAAPPVQVFQVATMLQSLYTTLSILISEFTMTNIVRNQIFNILTSLVTTTSAVSGGGPVGPTGPTGPMGPPGAKEAISFSQPRTTFESTPLVTLVSNAEQIITFTEVNATSANIIDLQAVIGFGAIPVSNTTFAYKIRRGITGPIIYEAHDGEGVDAGEKIAKLVSFSFIDPNPIDGVNLYILLGQTLGSGQTAAINGPVLFSATVH